MNSLPPPSFGNRKKNSTKEFLSKEKKLCVKAITKSSDGFNNEFLTDYDESSVGRNNIYFRDPSSSHPLN